MERDDVEHIAPAATETRATYFIWGVVNLPFAVAVYGRWGTQWWESSARHIMGV